MLRIILILLFLSTAAHAEPDARITTTVEVNTPCSMYDGCEVVVSEDGIVNY